jgi:hypothetical protein
VAPGDGHISAAAAQLLEELSARGIQIHDAAMCEW